MSKPVYEIPIGDGESWPAAGRRSQREAETTEAELQPAFVTGSGSSSGRVFDLESTSGFVMPASNDPYGAQAAPSAPTGQREPHDLGVPAAAAPSSPIGLPESHRQSFVAPAAPTSAPAPSMRPEASPYSGLATPTASVPAGVDLSSFPAPSVAPQASRQPAIETPQSFQAPPPVAQPAVAPPVAPPVSQQAAPPTSAPPTSAPLTSGPLTSGPPSFAPPAVKPAFVPRSAAHAAGDEEEAAEVAPLLLSDRAPSTGDGQEGSDPDLVAALNAVVLAGASDLHITVNAPPMVRVDGGLRPVPDFPIWDGEKVDFALGSILSEKNRGIFEENLELDFAYTLSETARFRVNFYQQRNVMGAAFRLIPTQIKQLATLGVPEKIGKFAQLPRGLVLVTGPTGSGKSTTLAALIDLVNSTRADHIVTVEDPIEFMHANKKSVVNQREVGHDTHSFANALKHVLRQDPDVILIGELRDLETISVALTAAETGHLVFATLHTQDAAQTIDRVIDVFPPHQQGQVRAQLAATLQGVVCQTLVKKAHGGGRAVATEVLIMTPAVSNLIREGKTYQIHSAMQAGRDVGMHTMDQHLADLVNAGQISHQAAHEKAHDLEDLKQLIQRTGGEVGTVAQSAKQSSGIDFGDKFSGGS